MVTVSQYVIKCFWITIPHARHIFAQEVVLIAGAPAGWRQTILSTCLDQSHDYSTVVPSGKPTKKLWKDPPFSMGKSTISMAMFNSYVKLPEGK
jgi:formylglycine-generating enzyme required for sulfatase activity